MVIDKINVKKKRADIDAIHNFFVQAERFCNSTSCTDILIKKNTSQGNESYHKISIDEASPQPLLHSIRTPTKENFNKTSEAESGTKANFIYNNIYIKNDVFDAFYED